MDVSNRVSFGKFKPLLSFLEKRGLSPQHIEDRILRQFKISKEELRIVLAAVLLGGFSILMIKIFQPRTLETPPLPEVSTVIPLGYVLVPIQLKNYETLDPILGPTGIADLFVQAPQGQKKMLVENARLLRAPRNPSVIAVLTPESQASEVLKGDQIGLYAVIKGQKQNGTRFVNSVPKRKSRISYLDEN